MRVSAGGATVVVAGAGILLVSALVILVVVALMRQLDRESYDPEDDRENPTPLQPCPSIKLLRDLDEVIANDGGDDDDTEESLR